MADEPDNLMFRMLRDVRAQMATKTDLAEMASKADLTALEERLERSTPRSILYARI